MCTPFGWFPVVTPDITRLGGGIWGVFWSYLDPFWDPFWGPPGGVLTTTPPPYNVVIGVYPVPPGGCPVRWGPNMHPR